MKQRHRQYQQEICMQDLGYKPHLKIGFLVWPKMVLKQKKTFAQK